MFDTGNMISRKSALQIRGFKEDIQEIKVLSHIVI